MEKVGDSQSSLGPVVPTSDKKMKRQLRELKVEAESLETCLEKIRGVLKKLRETGDIKDWFPETDGTVLVLGYVDPETLRTELENEAGVAIKSITGATTNSSHIGEDGTVTQIVRTEKLCMPYKIPRMDSPEFDDDRPTEILNHSENPMEHGNNSQWRSRGVMANDLERGDATGSEFPNEVSDNPKRTLGQLLVINLLTSYLAQMFRIGGHRRSSPTGQSPSASGQAASPSAAGPSHAPSPPTAVGPSPSPPQPSLVQSPNPSPVQSATDPHRETIVPHGDSFENSVTIIRQINRIVNNHWGGASMTYTSTPGPTKDLWWTEFKRAFTWDPSHELEIKRIFLKKCGDHIRHTLHHAKDRNKKPPCITDENWTRIKGVWETDESKQRSHQNKANQSYNSGDSSATYAGGSINIEEHTRRLTKEMGKEPLFIETFTRTFQKKDKTWSGDRARAMKEKYDEAELAQRSSSASENADGSEPSVGNDLSIWLDVTGGSKGGRILGMDSLSRTHRVAATSSSSSTQPTMRAQIDSLTEEVSHLKGIIIQRDQEMREMRRQQNEKMSEMRRQQQLIMQHFQLGSAPSQLPQVPDDDDDGDDGEDDSS